MSEKIIIDATNATLGRLASYAAKQALLGKDVVILNCSLAVISGRRESILSNYKQKRARGSTTLKGPHYPRSPERIMKRTVRGMLSYTQGRGSVALKKVMCYNEVPLEYETSKKILAGKEKRTKTMTLGELSRLI
ncbi:50S ribosomal protein L13 [Candidatus Pacearchaeota archaeon]|nr:50S ribosomal protein L13 [Candidatus Pacearchaeota archaeon]